MTYGFDAERLAVWIDSFERMTDGRAGVLCRRHADAMVVPLGWMLDDRRDPEPRLFKTPATTVPAAPRSRRAVVHHQHDAEQLELGAEEPVAEDEVAGITEPEAAEVLPWKPTFDQTDDLDGLLEAQSPLLARAFGGRDRGNPNR